MDEFNIAAGFDASDLRLMFRMIFASMVTFWAAWIIWRQYKLAAKEILKWNDYFVNVLKLLFLWTFLILLVVI